MSILQLLKQTNNFTDNEKRIADYILDHLESISKLTITDLAAATYTSHSAIIRLAHKLNYSGYKELKNALIKASLLQLNQARHVDNNFPFDETTPDKDATITIADLMKNTINETVGQLDIKTFSKICDCLLKANKIMMYGQGDSQITARDFQNKLVKIDQIAIISEEYREEAWNSTNLTSDDCALFITYSGKMNHYRKIMGYLKSQQIPIVLLSGNPESDLLKFATYYLITDNKETDFAKVAPFSSQVGFQFLLNSIYACMFKRHFERNIKTLQTRQSIIEEGILSDNAE